MSIVDQIENRIEIDKNEKTRQLWKECKEIVKNIIQHNNQIITQMNVYDIHDKQHSEAVLDIIEKILNNKISALSCYELILIYMSAYLHDSAMALPKWEYELLRSVEGTESCHDNTLLFIVCNDGKPVHKFSEALDIITKNEKVLFDYETAKKYVCARDSKEEMINSLADLMCSYEEFRNGYSADLEQCNENVVEYLNMSMWIRREYIRQTHHVRVVDNVKVLKKTISSAIGNVCAEYFLDDLAAVCRCHGEEIHEVYQLEVCRKDWENNTSNIQFVAVMLRLGDIIHFCSDRAPLSLFAEKQIKEEISYMHWNAKFQELSYDFIQEKEPRIVKYTAYCKEPDAYYFIQDYLDGVDKEIDHYFSLTSQWVQTSGNEKYRPMLGAKVDRSDIKYDVNSFKPDSTMKFVLNQSKILELLMGVQLYKDKFLCLREIYQNALDASKCMLAYNKGKNIDEHLYIQFGVGEETVQGNRQKYIYCLDHGTGMNEYIIHNYLLHIGNSYYRSRDFARENAQWCYDVKPTSQFGIGILSGYMLADKIGISTVYYKVNSQTISFIMEGKSEHFYYVNPSEIDKEMLGMHGTLVKLYLKPKFASSINAKYLPKLPIALMTNDEEVYGKFFDKEELKYNLFYLLNKHICICHPDISVKVKDEVGEIKDVFQGISIFDREDYPDITEEDLKYLWKSYHYFDGKNPYMEFQEKRKFIQDYLIVVKGKNINVYSKISLPKKGIGDVPIEVFRYAHFLGGHNDSICVDGIIVQSNLYGTDDISKYLGYDIVHESILDFIGEQRPVLSVDRKSCLSIPPIKEELKQIRERLIEEIKKIVEQHLKENKIEINDPELALVFNCVIRYFPSLAGEVFSLLNKTELTKAAIDNFKMQDLFENAELFLDNIIFLDYQEVVRQILVSRAMNAEKLVVEDNNLTITGGKYQAFPYERYSHYKNEPSLHTFVLRADVWTGIYKEYDLVSRFWPVVSPELFDSLANYDIQLITEHCKTIGEMGNGIQGIANLDPVMIRPCVGISSKRINSYSKADCYVGKFEQIENQYWLFELSNHGETTRETNVSPALFVYISPRKLNEKEEKRLVEFEGLDDEYVKGVRAGWSILFLGAVQKYVIVSGRIDREEIIKRVPASFFELQPEIKYTFPDGTHFDKTGILDKEQ